MGSNESHFNVSQDSVQKTTTFQKRIESRSGIEAILPFCLPAWRLTARPNRVLVGHPLDQVRPGRLGTTHTQWFPACLAYKIQLPPLKQKGNSSALKKPAACSLSVICEEFSPAQVHPQGPDELVWGFHALRLERIRHRHPLLLHQQRRQRLRLQLLQLSLQAGVSTALPGPGLQATESWRIIPRARERKTSTQKKKRKEKKK